MEPVWDVGMEKEPLIQFKGDQVVIENFRNFRYECDGSHQENYCLLYTSPSPRDRG